MQIKTLLLISALSAAVMTGCQPASDSGSEANIAETVDEASSAAVDKAKSSKAPIVLPGAPGKSSRLLNAEEAIEIAENSYSPDDVAFMQNMIPHHAQAVVMSNLVEERTNNEAIIDIATRIKASQADEIKFMQDWLSERGEDLVPPSGDGAHGSHTGGDLSLIHI